MQHLLHRVKWDAEAVRDDVRAYVVEHLAATVGVQRQYTGTAGRIENAQAAVYLVHSATRGTPPSIVPCTCPALGPRTPIDAGTRAFRMIWPSPPSPNSPPAWSSGRSTREPPDPESGLATALGRKGREGRAELRLGTDRYPRPRVSTMPLVPGGPPQRSHRRTHPLPLFLTSTGAAVGTGQGGRTALDDRGGIPGRQGSDGLDEHQVRRWTSWHRGSPSRCSPTPSLPSPQPPNAATGRPSTA